MTLSTTLKLVGAVMIPVVLIACIGGSAGSLEPNKSSFAEKPTISDPLEEITIAAVGDMMIGSAFPDDSRLPPNDGVGLLDPAAEILSSADIAFGNLEGPLADGGASTKCRPNSTRCYAFRMPTRYGAYFKKAGFDIVSVANNHASDFGAAGRRSTRETLDKLGIHHAGSDSGSHSTTYLTVHGKKIAFIGFATNSISLNLNNLRSAGAAVRNADRQADIVVVSFHGGAEGPSARRVPSKTEIFLGERRGNLPLFTKTVIDAGADLVIGHGPHVLRGMQIYNGRLIAYSLGNFATYGRFRLAGATAETMILTVRIADDGSFIGGRIHPFKLEGLGKPEPDKSGSAIKTVRELSTLDFPDSAPVFSSDGSIKPRAE